MRRATYIGGLASYVVTGAIGMGVACAAEGEGAANLEEVLVTGRFIEASGKSALKMDVEIRDVPFSLATYGESFMEAVDTPRVADLYGYMAGVQRSGGSGYDISIRGFSSVGSDRNTIMVDGLPGLSARFGSSSTTMLQSVEVVKGPASVLYGRTQPGGFVNLITKKPEATRKTAVELRTSSYGGGGRSFGDDLSYIASVDSTGPIDSQGKFLYRAITEYESRESFRADVDQTVFAVVPSLTWNISDDTRATLMLEYRRGDGTYDQGLVAPNLDYRLIAPITTHYQEPGDTQEEEGKVASLLVRHSFNEDISLNVSVRSVRNQDHSIGLDNQAVRPNLVTLQRVERDQLNKRKYNFIDSQLTAGFATGGIEHKLLTGFTIGREETDQDRLRGFTSPIIDIEIYNPVYGDVPGVGPPQSHTLNKSTSYGFYVTDMVTLTERWKAVAGVRHEKEDQSSEELRLVTTSAQRATYSETLPMVGLLFQPNDVWSLYTSYSTSFVPPQASARPFDPSRALQPQSAGQIEVGVKYEAADGTGSGTLAVFDIDKKDVLQAIGNTGLFDQVGQEQSRGAEVEVNVRPTDALQLTAAYSFIESEITDDVVLNRVGSPTQNAPKHSASVLLRYQLSGFLSNFSVSGGVVHRSERLGSLPTAATRQTLKLPAYTVADLAVYYVGDSFDASLKLANVFDEEYYQHSFVPIRIGAGEPRQLSLMLRKRF
ncbi:TonB-dependent siderophore receptor [Steroidobacter sp.]|uniref:TonB-dependent siderophore receptor n=1 Tax=Steroidobacter sp. TaxID=1978227 RepID=UPI001A572031|nr:TonB-dependent receptor [Steroidobacter sp.]MBL8265801.1 TonB-dependent receptor [Steroidobacter sp.]